MGRWLERRIKKLEERVGGFPCAKPGHGDFMLFVTKQFEAEVSAEDQAKIDDVRACERCKDKLIIVLTHFDPDHDGRTEEPKPQPLDFIFGEDPPEEPLILPAPWLKNLLTIGDD